MEWAKIIFFIPQKNGTLHFCVVYRQLNLVWIWDWTPISCTAECIDSLGDTTIFSILDSNSRYWQVEAEEDRDKSVFTFHHGLFRFICMPCVLKNAPETFQGVMEIVLNKHKWQFSFVYAENLVIRSRTADKQIYFALQTLTSFCKAGETLNMNNCLFFMNRINYISHVIHLGAPRSQHEQLT